MTIVIVPYFNKLVIAVPSELILSASSLKTALYLTRAFSYSPFRNNFSPSAITAAGNIWTDITIVKLLVLRSHKVKLGHIWKSQVKLPPLTDLPCLGYPYSRLLFKNWLWNFQILCFRKESRNFLTPLQNLIFPKFSVKISLRLTRLSTTILRLALYRFIWVDKFFILTNLWITVGSLFGIFCY